MGQLLLMPHEDIARYREKLPTKHVMAYYSNYLHLVRKAVFSDVKTKIDLGQALFNGESSTNIHYKYEFVEMCRHLNFNVPEQIKFDRSSPYNTDELTAFFKRHKKVLCKPEFGTMGGGIFVVDSQEKLIPALEKTKEPYLVQSFHPPLKDYRYIYHLADGATYRVCYEKKRPMVIGDGVSTVKELIETDHDIPKNTKTKLLKTSRKKLESIPAEDENVELVSTGNISKGAYGSLVRGDSLEAIDKLMLALIDALKEEYDVSLTTYCFDIGILSENLHPDTIRRDDIVFYEFQMPFAFSGYLDAKEVGPVRKETMQLLKHSLQKNWIDRELKKA